MSASVGEKLAAENSPPGIALEMILATMEPFGKWHLKKSRRFSRFLTEKICHRLTRRNRAV
jgi:hypothetical protein